jgi:hypothetical protein
MLVVMEDIDRYYDCYTNRDVSYKVCNSVADLQLNFINHKTLARTVYLQAGV